jgi:uncharacterized protein with von Willebrand factor type A (vWA) domain
VFEGFFYGLRAQGISISPTSFLRLQKALSQGLIRNLDDFYSIARAVMVKTERHFDLYDQVFAAYFLGKEIDDRFEAELSDQMQNLLEQWLQDPLSFPFLDDEEREKLRSMDPEELMEYFKKRLEDQTERHDGGNRWIGTGGTSPVGHSGYHPNGMRVGGSPGNRSAIKVAMDRRYIDYAEGGMLTPEKIGDAMARLKLLRPDGPKDEVDIDETIDETVRQGGEIEIIFKASLRDKMKVVLMLDNGGWSMTPYVKLCRSLFTYARNQFKLLRTYYFHNCIYDQVWADPQRLHRELKVNELTRWNPEWRVIIVGDASMSPWELSNPHGAIEYGMPQTKTGKDWLERIREHFPHSVWINPIPEYEWDVAYGAQTIGRIGNIFPMFELSVKGLEKAVEVLSD